MDRSLKIIEQKNAQVTYSQPVYATSTEGSGTVCIEGRVHEAGALVIDISPEKGVYSVKVSVELEREANAHIRILHHGTGGRKLFCRTWQIHQGSGSQSFIELRGVVEETASVDYIGELVVPEDLESVKAEQRAYGLLLSDQAKFCATPAMSVTSCSAECIHGVAAEGLDPEVIYYFSSRGIDYPTAKQLYIAGFLS